MARRKRLPAAGGVNTAKEAPVLEPGILPGAKKTLRIAGLVITIVSLMAYGQVRNFKFVNLDDGIFIYRNPVIREGVSADAIRWALLAGLSIPSMRTDYWQPVTQLSRLGDIELFGLNPGGHHLMNLFVHLANSFLVILLFHRLTGSAGAAAFIAGVFALHPLQVESVAWVTERKNLLGALFGFLSILAYLRHAASPSLRRYFAVVGLFALSLMSKPIFLTLPFLLLVLDGWPIRRAGGIRANALEKLPLLLLSVASALITLQTPTPIFEERSWFDRAASAPVSAVEYLDRYFAPRNLSVMYPPYAFPIPILRLAVATLALIAISYFVARFVRKIPALVVGWIWFLAMLLPVLFLTENAPADRFTYVADLGLSLMITGAACEWGRTAARRRGLAAAGAGSLLILSIVTWNQVSIWHDTGTLFNRVIEVSGGSTLIHNTLARYFIDQGDRTKGKVHLLASLEIDPNGVSALNDLGNLYLEDGNEASAEALYQRAIAATPNGPVTLYNLGLLRIRQGRSDSAIANFRQVIAFSPTYVDAHYQLGIMLEGQGQSDEAMSHFLTVLDLDHEHAEAHNKVAGILASRGMAEEASEHLYTALGTRPDFPEAHNNLAILLAGKGKMAEAIFHFSEAVRLNPQYANAHANLGQALLAQGKAGLAMEHLKEALRIDPRQPKAQAALVAAERLRSSQHLAPRSN